MASCQQVVPTQPSATSAATTSAGTTATTPPATPPANIFSVYARAWLKPTMKPCNAHLSAEAKARIEQSTFVKRYQNIFGGIEARELEARQHTNESGPSVVLVDEKTAILAFAVTMQTLAGPVALDGYQMRMVLEPGTTQPAWKSSTGTNR
jgi:penicillin-binding protein